MPHATLKSKDEICILHGSCVESLLVASDNDQIFVIIVQNAHSAEVGHPLRGRRWVSVNIVSHGSGVVNLRPQFAHHVALNHIVGCQTVPKDSGVLVMAIGLHRKIYGSCHSGEVYR